jgi:hypothetical protein
MSNKVNLQHNVSRILTVLALLFAFFIANFNVSAQDNQIKQTKIKTNPKNIENIVRTGTINLKKIDKNKDVKVFQCPMDWNVISDKAGKCPVCKMDLTEVALKKAKDNLVKHGFKAK